MAEEIRMAGPGKFEGGYLLNEKVHEAALEGVDAESGTVEERGWYGLLESLDGVDTSELNEAEKEFLKEHVGAILHEDAQGFVQIRYFKELPELLEEWGWVEAHTTNYSD